jgi:hypothetical protein
MSFEDLRFKLREPNVQFGIYIAAMIGWIVFCFVKMRPH